MKPKFRCLFVSSCPVAAAAITLCMAGSAYSQTQDFWNGSVSSDWNVGANWDSGAVPEKATNNHHAVVNTNSGNIATISADIVPPVDVFVGLGGGSSGRLDQTAGNASTGDGNWMFVGQDGGTGVFNLADTTTAGGGISGFGQGSGTMAVGGNLWVGGFNGATGANGTVNMNTSGTLSTGGNFAVGANQSTGVFNHESGTVTVGSEFWLGDDISAHGTYNMSGGTLEVNNWMAVGRRDGQGVFNLSAGTVNKGGGGNLTISTGDNGGSGIINQTGGVFNNTTGTFVGESWNGDGNGTWNISGGTANLLDVIVGNGGNSTGTINLDGGTFKANQIRTTSGGASTFNFNGGTLQAGQSRGNFMEGLTVANVKAGGAVIDTNGFNIGISQDLLEDVGSTGGGLIKNGAGILRLGGANTITGGITFNEGGLVAGTTASIAGWNAPGTIVVDAGKAYGATLGGAGFTNTEFETLMSNATYAAGSGIIVDTSLGDATYTNDLGTTTSAGTSVGLVKSGGNTLVTDLGGQTFTGGIVIAEGALALDHASDVTYNGTITGGGGLYVEGAGITTLNGSGNAIGGNLIIADAGGGSASTNGTLVRSSGDFTVNNEVWVGNGAGADGSLNIGGSTVTNVNNWIAVGRGGSTGTLTMTGGTLNKAGNGNVVVGTGGGTGTINQSAGAINITDSETWLGEGGSASWTMSGTAEANIGRIHIGTNGSGSGSLGVSDNAVMNAGVVVVGWANDQTGTLTLAGNGAVNAAEVHLGHWDATVGTVQLDGGTLGTTGIISNNGNANGYSGGSNQVNFNGGTLKALGSSADFISNPGSKTFEVNVQSGGANIDSNGNDITIGQSLADGGGGGGLSKTGAGTLTLGAANGYTGATSVDEGTLALGAGGLIANSSTIDIAAGATLDVSAASGWTLATGQTMVGNGTVEGSATIAPGASIAAGNSIGTITVTGDLTLDGLAAMEVEDGSSDLVNVLGSLTYGGDLDLSNIGGPITGYGWAPTTFDLFDFADQSGSFDSINLPGLDPGFSWTSFNYADGSISVVPEPSAALLGALGMLGLLVRRRRG